MTPQLLLKALILVFLFASVAVADDFATVNGKEYKNAQVTSVEPDGIMVKTKSGLSKIYFTELPKDVQERFHYDPQQGAQYTAHTLEVVRQQQDEAQKQAEQKRAELEVQRQQAEVQRQQAEVQRQQAEVQQQAAQPLQPNIVTGPTYTRSQEGIQEHTYELVQDFTINFGGVSIRLRRGERYHGRILVDHAEIDRDGRSYNVPSGILRKID
jgi:sRNA-binding protein